MIISDIQKQKTEWKRKGWSIPDFRGSKQDWFNIVSELVNLLGKNPITDISLSPELNSTSNSYPWRTYTPFLKGIGIWRFNFNKNRRKIFREFNRVGVSLFAS